MNRYKARLIGILGAGLLFHSTCQLRNTTGNINDPYLEAKADQLLQPFVKRDMISGSILIAKEGLLHSG